MPDPSKREFWMSRSDTNDGEINPLGTYIEELYEDPCTVNCVRCGLPNSHHKFTRSGAKCVDGRGFFKQPRVA